MGLDNINDKVDSWSLGTVLYNLTCGKMPFRGSGMKLSKNVIRKEPNFDGEAWQQCSPALRDLTVKLLNKDPLKRITVSDAL